MILIGDTRLRSLERNLHYVEAGAPVVVGLTELDQYPDQLHAVGFGPDPAPGERLLPAPKGPVSRFNAEGRWEKHRDQPKETDYSEINWEWKLWDGTWMSETRYREYERYPRTKVSPPAVELEIEKSPEGDKVLVTDSLPYTVANETALLHRINLLRELFGAAAILTDDLDQYTKVEIKRLNWQLLPAGELPWAQLQSHVEPLIDELGARKAPVAERRLKLLTEDFTPDLAAVGQAGFRGYLVFGFGETHILESLYYGNATYVFGEDWEELSQLSKAEIIHGSLEQDRIVHRENWETQIRELLG